MSRRIALLAAVRGWLRRRRRVAAGPSRWIAWGETPVRRLDADELAARPQAHRRERRWLDRGPRPRW